MRRLFILRPQPGASASVEDAEKMGMTAVAVPLFEVVPLPWTAPDTHQFDALLLTSANALRHGGDQLSRLKMLPVHAVGKATASAAGAAGFSVESVGTGGIESLLGQLRSGLRLLHLCGEHRRSVQSLGQTVVQVPVYRSRVQDPPPNLELLEGQVAAVHSPRAAERLGELLSGAARSTIRIAAISSAAANAAGAGWNRVLSADVPTNEALLALAKRLCED